MPGSGSLLMHENNLPVKTQGRFQAFGVRQSSSSPVDKRRRCLVSWLWLDSSGFLSPATSPGTIHVPKYVLQCEDML